MLGAEFNGHQRHTHVMVWGAVCADRPGPLIIWDKNWGRGGGITSKAQIGLLSLEQYEFFDCKLNAGWPTSPYRAQRTKFF